jgi:hypothetical protein
MSKRRIECRSRPSNNQHYFEMSRLESKLARQEDRITNLEDKLQLLTDWMNLKEEHIGNGTTPAAQYMVSPSIEPDAL